MTWREKAGQPSQLPGVTTKTGPQVLAGSVDIVMVSGIYEQSSRTWCANGRAPEQQLDAVGQRALAAKRRLGLFDEPQPRYFNPSR